MPAAGFAAGLAAAVAAAAAAAEAVVVPRLPPPVIPNTPPAKTPMLRAAAFHAQAASPRVISAPLPFLGEGEPPVADCPLRPLRYFRFILAARPLPLYRSLPCLAMKFLSATCAASAPVSVPPQDSKRLEGLILRAAGCASEVAVRMSLFTRTLRASSVEATRAAAYGGAWENPVSRFPAVVAHARRPALLVPARAGCKAGGSAAPPRGPGSVLDRPEYASLRRFLPSHAEDGPDVKALSERWPSSAERTIGSAMAASDLLGRGHATPLDF